MNKLLLALAVAFILVAPEAANSQSNKYPDKINVWYELTINPGCAEELRNIAKQMTAVNSIGEPDTLLYDVYINEDKSLLTFWHTQKDSDALLFHVDRFSKGDFVSQIMEHTSNYKLAFYGNVSKEAKQWMADNDFEADFYEYIDGFQR